MAKISLALFFPHKLNDFGYLSLVDLLAIIVSLCDNSAGRLAFIP